MKNYFAGKAVIVGGLNLGIFREWKILHDNNYSGKNFPLKHYSGIL